MCKKSQTYEELKAENEKLKEENQTMRDWIVHSVNPTISNDIIELGKQLDDAIQEVLLLRFKYEL